MALLTSVSPPTDGVKHVQPCTKLLIRDRDIGCGTLYITESKLAWRNASGEGLSILYPRIAVHAVSRDIQQFGAECLIIMLDTRIEEDDEENEDDSVDGMTELRFVPEDKNQLDVMYRAMTHCQSLHPDPIDSCSEEEEYESADDNRVLGGGDSRYINGHCADVGTNELRALSGLRIGPQGDEELEMDGQFEDAEDD